MVNCYGKLEGSPVVAQTSVVLDQADIYTSVIVTAEQNGVELTRIQVRVKPSTFNTVCNCILLSFSTLLQEQSLFKVFLLLQ